MIDGELETVDTTQWYPRLCARTLPSACSQRKRTDDLDQQFYENYVCGAERNFGGYCKRKLDELIDGQSIEPDREKPDKSSGGNVGVDSRGRKPWPVGRWCSAPIKK